MLRGGVAYIRNIAGWNIPCEAATEDREVDITKQHCLRSIPRDPLNCAIAKGLASQGIKAIVYRTVTYTWDNKKISYYVNSRAVQDFELLSDVRKSQPYRVLLYAPTPSYTEESKKLRAKKTSIKRSQDRVKRAKELMEWHVSGVSADKIEELRKAADQKKKIAGKGSERPPVPRRVLA